MDPVLTKCPLFRGLSLEKIVELLPEGSFEIRNYLDGQVIARQETAYSGLMILLKGRARGEHRDTSGGVVRIDNICAPQLIAPAFLFGGYNRLPIDVVADGATRILVLHRGYLFELMQENTLILSNFIDILSNRANFFSRKIYFLSLRSVNEKVLRYLLDHGREEFTDSVEVSSISDYLDVTESAVRTVLGKLAKTGVVELTESGMVQIPDRGRLEELLQRR